MARNADIHHTQTGTISPAVWYARILGVVLTLVGIVGLFLTMEMDVVKSLVGFDVNLFHNLVHLVTGIIALVIGFAVLNASVAFAWVFGIVYALLGVWGLVSGGAFDPFGLFGRINMADHVLHLAIGVAGIAAALMSRRHVDTDRGV